MLWSMILPCTFISLFGLFVVFTVISVNITFCSSETSGFFGLSFSMSGGSCSSRGPGYTGERLHKNEKFSDCTVLRFQFVLNTNKCSRRVQELKRILADFNVLLLMFLTRLRNSDLIELVLTSHRIYFLGHQVKYPVLAGL